MLKNTASQHVSFHLLSTTDGSDVTSGSPTVYYTIDGGTQTSGSGTLTHEGNGEWGYVPTQAETNGNHVAFTITLAGAFSQTINVYPSSIDYTTSTVDANLEQIDGVAITETSNGRLAANFSTFFDNDDGATAKTVDDVGTATVSGVVSANVTQIAGTAVTESTAGRLAANFSTVFDNADALTAKTADDIGTASVSGTIDANIVEIHGTTINETTSGRLAGNFETFFENSDSATTKTVDNVGTGTGVFQADLVQIKGESIDETTAGRLATNFETFFDNADAATTKTVDDVGVGTGTFNANVVEIAGTAVTETTTGRLAGNFSVLLDNADAATTVVVDDIGSIKTTVDAQTAADPFVLLETTIASVQSTTVMRLTEGAPDDDAYPVDSIVVCRDQSTANQIQVGKVADWDGTNLDLTFDSEPNVFTLAAGDTVQILATADVQELVTSFNSINAVANVPVGQVSGFPTEIVQGDAYTVANGREIKLYFKDAEDNTMTSFGTKSPSDSDFTWFIRFAPLDLPSSGDVNATVEISGDENDWITTDPLEPYLQVELPSSDVDDLVADDGFFVKQYFYQVVLQWGGDDTYELTGVTDGRTTVRRKIFPESP